MVGKAEVGLIVLTPPPAMLKLIVSRPAAPAGASPEAALVLAAVIASRSVTTPSLAIVSPVPVTVIVASNARHSRGSSRRMTDFLLQSRRRSERIEPDMAFVSRGE